MKLFRPDFAAALAYVLVVYTTAQATCRSAEHAAVPESMAAECDNFYTYTCSGQHTKKGITRKYLKEELMKKIKEILSNKPSESSSTLDTPGEDVKAMAKQIYDFCRGDSHESRRGKIRNDLRHILEALLGINDWPRAAHTKGMTYQSLLSTTGMRPLASLKVVPNEESGAYLLTINILNPRFAAYPNILESIQNPERIALYNRYKALIRAVLRLFTEESTVIADKEDLNEASSRTNVNDDSLVTGVLNDIIEVETKLYKMSLNPFPNPNYTMRSVEEWQEIFGGTFPFSTALQQDFKKAGTVLSSSTKVGIHNEKYFDQLAEYLPQLELKKLIRYFGWYFAREMADLLIENIRKRLNEFLKEVPRPVVSVKFNDDICVEKLIGYQGIMEAGIAHLYLKEHFSADCISKADSAVPGLNMSLSSVIEKNCWMDLKSRKAMQAWVANLQYRMGASAKLLDERLTKDQYNHVKRSELKSLLLSFFHYKENNYLQNIKLSDHIYDREDIWPMSSLETATWYSEVYTIVEVPAAFLQTPIFTCHEHISNLFGSQGTSTAETLGNGIVQEGRVRFQRSGRYEWTKKTKDEFNKAIRCLKISRDETRKETKGTVTAQDRFDRDKEANALHMKLYDHMGLRIAFNAFVQSLEENGAASHLERKALVKKFFEAYVLRHCGYGTAIDDEHRVNFALKTYKEFWDAFDCKSGQKMRAEDKCEILPKSKEIVPSSAPEDDDV